MPTDAGIPIVWLKRDLRIQDHEPLSLATRAGPMLPLYIVEPDLWQQPDMALRHWAFIRECLEELRDALAALGQPLVVREGEAVVVLRAMIEKYPVAAIWSHQETGNGWTFARDRAVAACLKGAGIPWQELRQHGVVRGRVDRDRWSRQWESLMGQARCEPPEALTPILKLEPGVIPEQPGVDLPDDPCPGRQRGGRKAGELALASFLREHGARYHQQMSSPVTAFDACSRLSPYLAYGVLSMREVLQRTRLRRAQVKAERTGAPWTRALDAFEGRLHWQCHFIQKLESEPRIEFENMQSGVTGINAMRTYNPVKQSLDQDPEGRFIRGWVPELSRVPTAWIHTPWRMPAEVREAAGCRIGIEYPAPLVDHEQAARQARQRLQVKRRDADAREKGRSIYERHGNRKRRARKTAPESLQTELPL